MNHFRKFFLSALLVPVLLVSCNKDDKDAAPEQYEVPTTYNFSNVNYTGQSQRIAMLEELSSYMKASPTNGTALELQKLKDMFANQNSPFSDASLNTAGKQIKDKTFAPDHALIESYFEKLVTVSQSAGTAGSNGQAGVVTSNDGTKKYLFDENGVEHIQLIEKGLMGALLYYQATAVYLSDEKIGNSVDNTTVTEGQGTKMEHHWDEAFGYLGVPKDYPANTSGLQFWGKYINSRGIKLGNNTHIMNAFITGRAAISNKDMEMKDYAVSAIRKEWERVIAACAISYFNGARKSIADVANRNHQLSEGVAFVSALKYNPTRKITDAQINQVVNALGTNYYAITEDQILAARDLVSSIYGMDSIKETL